MFAPFIPPQPFWFHPSASGPVGSPSTQQPNLLFVQSNKAVGSGNNKDYKVREENGSGGKGREGKRENRTEQ